MIKTSFSLKRPDSLTPTAVYMRCQCSDGRLTYYTNITVLPSKWDKPSQGLSLQLAKITNEVNQYEEKCALASVGVTRAGLSEALDTLLDKKKKITDGQTMQRHVNVFKHFAEVINKMTTGEIVTPKKTRYKKGTIRIITHHVTVFQKFSPNMKAGDINMFLYKAFLVWCQNKKYATNYIGTLIKNWKMLCTHCGIVLPGGFKKISEEASTIALTEEEILKIYNVNYQKSEIVVKDWFVLDCYTGLRVGDLTVLGSDHLNPDKNRITIANEKTTTKVVIPTHPLVKEILKKYKGFPPKVSDVEINREIKTVARRAGLTKNIIYSITKGGLRVNINKPQWSMITNHTARRSFITNLLKNGVPAAMVMKLTGIRTAATLEKYNKLTAEDAATYVETLDFFKTKAS